MIAKNLIILVALVVVAFVGVFSWFSKTTTANAGNLTAKTKVSDALEYFIMPIKDSNGSQVDQYSAINTWITNYNQRHASDTGFVAKEWHKGEITLDYSDPEFKFMEDLFLCETTSDGKDFKIPKLIQYGEIAYVDTTAEFDDAVANQNYMSFDIYFRSKNQYDVFLREDSSIAPKTAIISNDQSESNLQSAAIGAVRLSVLNANNERQLLWIPAPCIWFDGKANNNEGSLVTGLSGNSFANKGAVTYNGTGTAYSVGKDSSNISRTEGTNEHAYFDTSNTRRIISPSTNVIASEDGSYTLGRDTTVVTLNQTDSANGYKYGHVRVNLWVEGEDAEARLKMVGGKFNMTLSFDVQTAE